MKSRLITAIAAAAVAVSGFTATPSHALGDREKDILKIIAGAAIIGAIINETRKDKKRGDKAQPVRNRIVPAVCLYEVRTSRGYREVVSRSCMEEYGLARRLPAECAFDIRTNRGERTVYGPRCLEDYGYRIEDVRY